MNTSLILASSLAEKIKSAFEVVAVGDYATAFLATMGITLISTLMAYLVGIPLGVLLYGTSEEKMFPNRPVNKILGIIVNVFRSIPFIILLVMIQPIAKLIVGKTIGNAAFIFYLTVAASPFIARMIETSLHEVDKGIIEAAQSMGAGNFKIICKVLIPEAKPSLLLGAAIVFATILGYTPMAYLIAGDGLGALAIQYGLYRFNPTVMYISSILLIILVQIMQEAFGFLARKTDRRISK